MPNTMAESEGHGRKPISALRSGMSLIRQMAGKSRIQARLAGGAVRARAYRREHNVSKIDQTGFWVLDTLRAWGPNQQRKRQPCLLRRVSTSHTDVTMTAPTNRCVRRASQP